MEKKLIKRIKIIFDNFKFKINESKLSNETFDINKQNIVIPDIQRYKEIKIENGNILYYV